MDSTLRNRFYKINAAAIYLWPKAQFSNNKWSSLVGYILIQRIVPKAAAFSAIGSKTDWMFWFNLLVLLLFGAFALYANFIGLMLFAIFSNRHSRFSIYWWTDSKYFISKTGTSTIEYCTKGMSFGKKWRKQFKVHWFYIAVDPTCWS